MPDLHEKLWNDDVWANAELFSDDCISFIDLIQFSSRRDISRINPSGRFQDSVLRQLQHLSYLIQGSIENEDNNDFHKHSYEFCEFAEANGYLSEELTLKLEATDMLLEAYEIELLYQSKSNQSRENSIFLSSASELLKVFHREPELVFDTPPRKFEEIVAEVFSQNGFEVELMQQTRDGGKDIVAVRSSMGIPSKYVIECKRYSPTRKVSLDIVQRLYGVKYALNANHGLVVTTSSFTKDALTFAKQNPWDLSLHDYSSLMDWINGLLKQG